MVLNNYATYSKINCTIKLWFSKRPDFYTYARVRKDYPLPDNAKRE